MLQGKGRRQCNLFQIQRLLADLQGGVLREQSVKDCRKRPSLLEEGEEAAIDVP